MSTDDRDDLAGGPGVVPVFARAMRRGERPGIMATGPISEAGYRR